MHTEPYETNEEAPVITYTTAEEAYDYRGMGTETICIAGKDSRGRTIRKVKTSADYVEDQRARYASGLHMAVDENEWGKLVDYKLVQASR